ncbi:MAG: hypothetical protein K0R72_602 [Clostridia bacterium]|jgi:hypothetical protein|nr:hypothetical protein [Clostridia bacterium]
MDITVIGLIVMGVFGIFYAVFTWKGSADSKTKHSGNTSKITPNKTGDLNKAAGFKKNNLSDVQRKDMFNFINFEKIMDDMILQEKGNKYTMVIQCKGINYDLMSEVEQLAVEEGFITFLNTLKSPIQLYVQARTIDLKTSLNIYKSKVNELNQKLVDSDDRVRKLSDNINTNENELREANVQRERLLNISEYAQDITRYVERLSLNKHLLQRKFYIILSYYKSDVNSTANFSQEEIHDICYRELYTRAQSIIGGLQACSVSSKVLNSNELAELLYISYNRDDEKLLDIKTALDSGFYRMYSTTKDIQDKKRESMQKIIQEEAMRRVEDAIRQAIDNGIIKSKDETVEEFENEADIAAVKVLEDTNIKPEDKRKIQEIIVENHNKGVEERQKVREEKKAERKEKKLETENKKTDDNNEKDKQEEKPVEKTNSDTNIMATSEDSIV